MEIDLYLRGYGNETISSFSTELIDKALGRFIVKKRRSFWLLEFPDGGNCRLFVPSEPRTESVTVIGPAAHPGLWRGLLDILQTTPSAINCPGRPALFLVGDPASIPHLPPHLITGRGMPAVATTLEDMLAVIERSGRGAELRPSPTPPEPERFYVAVYSCENRDFKPFRRTLVETIFGLYVTEKQTVTKIVGDPGENLTEYQYAHWLMTYPGVPVHLPELIKRRLGPGCG
jgi:hypothetical protein